MLEETQDGEECLKINVSMALQRAVLKKKSKANLVNANYKVSPVYKEYGEKICAAVGLTMSEFLRECVEMLVDEYQGPKASRKLSEAITAADEAAGN